MTTLEQATKALKDSYESAGKGELFEALRPGLVGGKEISPYAELAAQHGLSTGAITMAIRRLRGRFANCIREEVMKTVDNEANFQMEMDSLYAALAN
jgi:RNA polymerase sigma-70 factor (ECF subfamily)